MEHWVKIDEGGGGKHLNLDFSITLQQNKMWKKWILSECSVSQILRLHLCWSLEDFTPCYPNIPLSTTRQIKMLLNSAWKLTPPPSSFGWASVFKAVAFFLKRGWLSRSPKWTAATKHKQTEMTRKERPQNIFGKREKGCSQSPFASRPPPIGRVCLCARPVIWLRTVRLPWWRRIRPTACCSGASYWMNSSCQSVCMWFCHVLTF